MLFMGVEYTLAVEPKASFIARCLCFPCRSAGRLEPKLRVGFLLLCCWNGAWGVLPGAGEAMQGGTLQEEGSPMVPKHAGNAGGFSGNGHGKRRGTWQKLPESQWYTISCNLMVSPHVSEQTTHNKREDDTSNVNWDSG